ncbi:MAG: hypothetical protein IKD28_04945 [Clostridia bacterium]|nr:hypothetical protein [Clostridia bacterium]
MFIAFDELGKRTHIKDAKPTSVYFCPVCGDILCIRALNSLAVKQHFSHKRGSKCLDNWRHDMSEWHINWQEQFPEEYREIVITKNGIKHRADILIQNTVIEFQHSPISPEEFEERNFFYGNCGYNVVWVFDATDKVRGLISEDPVDPMQCHFKELYWKRAKSTFRHKVPDNVSVYLQYKSMVSNENFQNQLFDIMIKTKLVTPKTIYFRGTWPCYIMPQNFLKEYGVITDEKVFSITQILNETPYKYR